MKLLHSHRLRGGCSLGSSAGLTLPFSPGDRPLSREKTLSISAEAAWAESCSFPEAHD